MLQRASPHCWKKVSVPSSGHNEGSTSFDSVHLHHSAGHPSRRAEPLKVTSRRERAGGGNGHGATRATKTTQGRIIQEAVMRVVRDDLKLGEIKGCDRSKEKGYPVKGAHNEGNGKSDFFFYF